MPSLLGTTVAANYGAMTPQQTYGVGTIYSNFGTRQLRFVQVVATAANGSTAVRFDKNDGTSGGSADYKDPQSVFSKAIRSLQTVGEIYYINVPNSTGFVVAVAEDTLNDSDTSSNVPGGYGDLEAAVVAACGFGGSSTCTVTAFTIAAA